VSAIKLLSNSNTTKKRKRDDRKKLRTKPLEELSACFLAIIKDLIDLPESSAFRKPVNSDIVKNYDQIIKTPMALDTIRQRVVANKYTSLNSIMRDLNLISDNCKLFNGAAHPLSRTIDQLVSTARQKLYAVILALMILYKHYEKIQGLQVEIEGIADPVKEEFDDVF